MSPSDRLREALIDAGAKRLSEISVGKEYNVIPYTLEFWLVPGGRLAIIQFWKGPRDGWDAYLQIREHETEKAIAEVLGRPT